LGRSRKEKRRKKLSDNNDNYWISWMNFLHEQDFAEKKDLKRWENPRRSKIRLTTNESARSRARGNAGGDVPFFGYLKKYDPDGGSSSAAAAPKKEGGWTA